MNDIETNELQVNTLPKFCLLRLIRQDIGKNFVSFGHNFLRFISRCVLVLELLSVKFRHNFRSICVSDA